MEHEARKVSVVSHEITVQFSLKPVSKLTSAEDLIYAVLLTTAEWLLFYHSGSGEGSKTYPCPYSDCALKGNPCGISKREGSTTVKHPGPVIIV